nr:hypothetical protein [Nocardiopsis akebiae]
MSVAGAPARKHRSTRRRNGSSSARLPARVYQRPSVTAGMALGACPPTVWMPWTRVPGGSCWRSRPMAAWATTKASLALRPSCG